jgi:hypothetical protein
MFVAVFQKPMKDALIAALLTFALLLVTLSASVFALPVLLPLARAAPAQLFGREPKKEDKTRLLTGKVLDSGDNPLPNAIVYLTNAQTRAVKTYIVGSDGSYRFPALQPSIDYEVYAQYDNRRSGTKTLSQFDDRAQVYIDLKVKAKAESGGK